MTPEKNSSIRKEVNKAKSKVAKNFFQVGLATSMILGAPACVPTEATSIIPTGETNPLPGDFTKTAESPTEATYEVTSTPGIESTINPPTEVATEMPTATATEMPTPTEIPEKYPIDLEKLHNFPQSYEYVVAHPEEFVEAPNPFKDIDAFNDWFYNKFVPLLGNYEEREVNYATSNIGMQPDFYVADAYRDPKDMLGEPEFFYFNNYGTLYPVITLNVFSDDQKSFIRTISIILYDGDYSGEGTGAINSLFREEKISGIALFRNERSLYPYPSAVNNLIKKGINAYRDELDYNQVVLGVGMLKTTGCE